MGIKRITIIVVLLLISSGVYAQTKIDPAFNFIERSGSAPAMVSSTAQMMGIKTVRGGLLVGALLRVNNIDLVSEAIEELGGEVNSKLKTVITANIPVEAVNLLAAMDEVLYIEASKKVRPLMNFARDVANVDVVQSGGGGLSQAYNGSGVVVGIVDAGVDCTHPDFADRIIAYWDMDSDTKFTADQISAGTECYAALTSSSYHGTHVAGIAAGADSTYTGVAPQASIAVSQVSSSGASDTDVIDGIEYVFEVAQARLEPAVANVSLGTSRGPHDGTSTFETGITEVVDGKQGRAVVCAGGNENVNPNDDVDAGNVLGGLHADVNVSGTDVGYESMTRSSSVTYMIYDIWLDAGSDCSVKLVAYDLTRTQVATTGAVAAGGEGEKEEDNLYIGIDFTDDENANNGKQHAMALMQISGTPATYDSTSLTYDLVFIDDGSGCQGDAWIYQDFIAYNVFTKDLAGTASPGADYTYVAGDSDRMITIPGTSGGCITVASFSARDQYTSKDGTEDQNVYDTSMGGTGTQASDISLFSSMGPAVGTSYTSVRQKPDIAAPGEPIISTMSQNISSSTLAQLGGDAVIATDDAHLKLEGTSMSAPFVTGVVALLMEKNHILSYSAAKTALTSTAETDAFTGSSMPDYEWGYGKVDALAAINSIEADDTDPDNPVDAAATSKKGCSLMAYSSVEDLSGFWIVLGLMFGVFLVGRVYLRVKA